MNYFKDQLVKGKLQIGAGISINSTEIIEIFGNLGFDWLFLDAEHSPLGAVQIQSLLQALPGNTQGIIRIPDHSETTIKKMLDIGPSGIIVPQVNSVEQAEKIIQYARFAPLGKRGIGVSRSNNYGNELGSYLSSANDKEVLIFQAEHKLAVENIESIIQVAGFDAVLIGPFDLSASYDKPGEIEHPLIQEAIDHIAVTCTKSGIPCGIFGPSVAFLKKYIARGFNFVIMSMDVLLLSSIASGSLTELRS